MKSFALVGSLIAILIIIVLMSQSIESVAPSASSSSPATQEAMIGLPASAADLTAGANAQVEAMEKAMRETLK